MHVVRPGHRIATSALLVVGALAGGWGGTPRKDAATWLAEYERRQGNQARSVGCLEGQSRKEWSCSVTRSDGKEVHAVVTLNQHGAAIEYNARPKPALAPPSFSRVRPYPSPEP
jgi:hypothetical protein